MSTIVMAPGDTVPLAIEIVGGTLVGELVWKTLPHSVIQVSPRDGAMVAEVTAGDREGRALIDVSGAIKMDKGERVVTEEFEVFVTNGTYLRATPLYVPTPLDVGPDTVTSATPEGAD